MHSPCSVHLPPCQDSACALSVFRASSSCQDSVARRVHGVAVSSLTCTLCEHCCVFTGVCVRGSCWFAPSTPLMYSEPLKLYSYSFAVCTGTEVATAHRAEKAQAETGLQPTSSCATRRCRQLIRRCCKCWNTRHAPTTWFGTHHWRAAVSDATALPLCPSATPLPPCPATDYRPACGVGICRFQCSFGLN